MTPRRAGLEAAARPQRREGVKNYTKAETTNFSDSADIGGEEREERRVRARCEAWLAAA